MHISSHVCTLQYTLQNVLGGFYATEEMAGRMQNSARGMLMGAFLGTVFLVDHNLGGK
jgi:hypothetical protein